MIRKIKIDEIGRVMKIWLEANIKAHDFIDENYWHKNYEPVKGMLPDAQVFVYEDNGMILGFVGLIDNYIAGIFVDTDSQSKGIGKVLLDFVKEMYSNLSLQVYKKNTRAVKFYLREGFYNSGEQVDVNTGETELLMNWEKLQ
jgi:putative acetyltransferase